jgi:hypothetical protein
MQNERPGRTIQTTALVHEALWRIASRVRSPIASRSHWLTAVMILITSLPAAEPVSSDSATETSETPWYCRLANRRVREASTVESALLR